MVSSQMPRISFGSEWSHTVFFILALVMPDVCLLEHYLSLQKQEKTRVIMLSLQNAASGTNLVEATHVILIDPVAGNKEEAVAIESQAIGRAHRMGQFKQVCHRHPGEGGLIGWDSSNRYVTDTQVREGS